MKSQKTIYLHYIGYVTIKDLKYVKINSVNPLYLFNSKANGYFEEINKNKFLTLVPINESKEIIKEYEERWSKIRDFMISITKTSDHYDNKYIKVNFNSDDDLPLNSTIQIHNATIVVRESFLR